MCNCAIKYSDSHIVCNILLPIKFTFGVTVCVREQALLTFKYMTAEVP